MMFWQFFCDPRWPSPKKDGWVGKFPRNFAELKSFAIRGIHIQSNPVPPCKATPISRYFKEQEALSPKKAFLNPYPGGSSYFVFPGMGFPSKNVVAPCRISCVFFCISFLCFRLCFAASGICGFGGTRSCPIEMLLLLFAWTLTWW